MVGGLLILLACFFWALDSLIRYPLVEKGISPEVIVFFEHAVLGLIFLPKLLGNFKRIGELRFSDAFGFLIIGGLGSAIATLAFTQAFVYLNPSLVILLQKFQPVIAIFLAWVMLKEPLPKPFIFWGAVCFLGAILISAPDLEKIWHLMQVAPEKLASDNAVRGYTLALAAVAAWGATTVFGKKLSMAGYETSSLLAGRFIVGLVVIAFFVPWGRSLIFTDATDYARILIMVIFSGLIAMGVYYQGLKRLPAKLCAILEMFFPLMAVTLNWFVLGKQLDTVQLLGGGLLLLGALVLQLKKY